MKRAEMLRSAAFRLTPMQMRRVLDWQSYCGRLKTDQQMGLEGSRGAQGPSSKLGALHIMKLPEEKTHAGHPQFV
jgi:hypothetical protein